ncbi:ribonuclease T [Allohahella marinimesophila]|uniref:Ribonuclease T n=1 Tax=Allohahella marinimesophila TaxID=1054972 RepID=A0ABP7P3C4_9GAMM
MSETRHKERSPLARRFRGFLPVVIDVECGGFNKDTDALLEIAAAIIDMDDDGQIYTEQTLQFNIEPFPGSNLDPAALAFTGIDPHNPLRNAVSEDEALKALFSPIRKAVKRHGCNRAIMVAHNATFDHGFLFAAAERVGNKRNPFHPFSTFDTVTLAGLAYGHTVLAKACQLGGIPFESSEAHSALYDTEKTAELFCGIVNRWKAMGGWQEDFL